MPVPSDRKTSLVDRAFRDDRDRLVLAEPPNAAIGVWAVATGVRLAADGAETELWLRGVATGALVVWALDELLRGATPFRRLLGAGVLAYQLVVLTS